MENEDKVSKTLRVGKYITDCPDCDLALAEYDKINENGDMLCPRCGWTSVLVKE